MRLKLPALLLLAITGTGCFETELDLSRGQRTTDASWCGDWVATGEDAEGGADTLLVRSFDGHAYYAEYSEAGPTGGPISIDTIRMRVTLFSLGAATFAQAEGLDDDCAPVEKHLLLRVEMAGDTLTLRHLDEDWFDGVTTAAGLRKRLTAGLEDPKMYEDAVTLARRQD